MKTHGFTLMREEQIDEYQIRARLYFHDTTGARLLSLCNDDGNKVFSISFPTVPDNSKGTAHIMEHSVLCGSEKYPVKEPFIELVKGSVNTYLNASTWPDYTTYPCASNNEKDFYNLIDVYVDAVFHPRLTGNVLKQEGWHYELDDRNRPLRYKGVVFNEMKGAYSSPEGYIFYKSNRKMLEGTGYQYSSGGEPEHIPELGFDEFMQFYRKWYHPSNAYIYFYGDDPEEKRLEKMAGYLKGFEEKKIILPDLASVSWSGEKNEVFSYPAQETQKNEYYRFTGWLLPDNRDPALLLGLGLLEQVLLGTQAAPLRKVLLESGLGTDITGNGFELHFARTYFSLGLKGVKKENLEKVDKLMIDTLAELASKGIEPDDVHAALNTFEFRLRENNTGNIPRGLQHNGRILASWIHDDDPFSPLRFESALADIRKKDAYFEALIREYLIDNGDRITFTAEPDPDFVTKYENEEAAKLASVKAGLDERLLDEIIAESSMLKKVQSEPDHPEDLARIPRLNLNDLDRKIRPIAIEPLHRDFGAPGYMHDIFTNGILYLDMGFDLHTVPARLLPLVPLFCRSLLLMGSRKEDYTALIRKIGIHTGGVRPVKLVTDRFGDSDPLAMLVFRTKLTYSNIPLLKDIMATLFTGINWDNRERFRQILLEEKSEYEAGIIYSGHSIVISRLRAAFSQTDWLQEQFGGISYLHFLRMTLGLLENDWKTLCNDLQELYSTVINRNTLILNLTMDGKHCEAVKEHIAGIAGLVPERRAVPADWTVRFDGRNEILATSTQVNFVGTGMVLAENMNEYSGVMLLVKKILSTDYLWNTVRVKGGAYGAFAAYNELNRTFSLVSYRDPLLAGTFKAYQAVPAYLQNFKPDKNELEKIKIGVIGSLDAPLLPDMQGYVSFRRQLAGISDVCRQEIRDSVFDAGEEDFHRIGVLIERGFREARMVALCSEETARRDPMVNDTFRIIKI
ncbi:MAG: insulinase family protein [Spirochaetales bacterium]|nr:insulinase family protein [Spirochaetales bacterium]